MGCNLLRLQYYVINFDRHPCQSRNDNKLTKNLLNVSHYVKKFGKRSILRGLAFNIGVVLKIEHVHEASEVAVASNCTR